MELNKTSSLYNCKHENHVSKHEGPEPLDSRDVKAFSLDTHAQPRQEAQTRRTSGRQEEQQSNDKNVEGASSEVSAKEDTEKEGEGEGGMVLENPMAYVAHHVEAASVAFSPEIVGGASVAVSNLDLEWVQEVIASTVETMLITDIGGEQRVELVLDNQGNVPEVFAGANLTLVQSGSDLSISLSNFSNEQQAIDAVNIVNNYPEQLATLVTSLKGHRLNITEFSVGTSVVQLPRVEEIQTPLTMIAATIHAREDEERQDQDEQQHHQDQEKEQTEEVRL